MNFSNSLIGLKSAKNNLNFLGPKSSPCQIRIEKRLKNTLYEFKHSKLRKLTKIVEYFIF